MSRRMAMVVAPMDIRLAHSNSIGTCSRFHGGEGYGAQKNSFARLLFLLLLLLLLLRSSEGLLVVMVMVVSGIGR